MIEGLIKIAGSLFIGGIGLVLILAVSLLSAALCKELIDKWRENNES